MIGMHKFAMVLLMVVAAFSMISASTNIAVSDLENRGGLTDDEVRLLGDRIAAELHKSGGLTVLERQQIDVILKEQGFQQSGACSDQECLVEIGQLLAVKYMVSGSVGKIGNSFVVNLKMVDVGTGKIESSASADGKASKSVLIARTVPETVHKLLRGLGGGTGNAHSESGAKRRRNIAIASSVGGIAVAGGAIAAVVAGSDNGGGDPDEDAVLTEVPLSDLPARSR